MSAERLIFSEISIIFQSPILLKCSKHKINNFSEIFSPRNALQVGILNHSHIKDNIITYFVNLYFSNAVFLLENPTENIMETAEYQIISTLKNSCLIKVVFIKTTLN